jgi:alkanesulfonate monooxygenase SsuD/methylene tetrahydromethanopterin reductase-like flavin-dependent oxidoreductase (luciferase family)
LEAVVEFGIFIQGYVPGPDAQDPAAEHDALMGETELIKVADRHNWKYMWASEHHGLPEYSHISASDAYLGYLAAATERIHLGSGIFNLSPRVNHPVRNAERAAMLDHLSEGRFEFGTGRGAGSHEIATFNIHDTSSTRVEWDEVVRELPRMWERRDYTFQGDHFAVDTPHDVLPKPYGVGHPPIWVACGSPSTFEKAGSLGIGALGFSFSPIGDMKPQIDAYKQGIADCTDPIGQFVNDNVMITNAVVCMEDGDRAREIATRSTAGYLYSLVCLYHDTFPVPETAPVWPESPIQIDRATVDLAVQAGAILAGTPEEVSKCLGAYAETGVDQLAFGLPSYLTKDEAAETIELFGDQVIPEWDTDPEHRTTKMRATAQPKYGPFAKKPPPIETIYTQA